MDRSVTVITLPATREAARRSAPSPAFAEDVMSCELMMDLPMTEQIDAVSSAANADADGLARAQPTTDGRAN